MLVSTMKSNCDVHVGKREFVQSYQGLLCLLNRISGYCIIYIQTKKALTLVLLNNIKKPLPLLIFSQSDYLILDFDTNSYT